MQKLFPNIIRYHLGDAEFSLLTTKASEQEPVDMPSALHCHRYYEIHWNTGPRKWLPLPTGDILLDADRFVLICPGCMHYSVPRVDCTCVLSFELRQTTGEAGFYDHFLGLLNGLNLQPLPEMYGKNLTFKTGGVDGCDCAEILSLIEQGKIDTTPLITHRYKLEDIEEAYHIFENKLDGVIKVAISAN